LTIKADESAHCAGRQVGRPPPHRAVPLIFFWGLEIAKCVFKNSDFGGVQI